MSCGLALLALGFAARATAADLPRWSRLAASVPPAGVALVAHVDGVARLAVATPQRRVGVYSSAGAGLLCIPLAAFFRRRRRKRDDALERLAMNHRSRVAEVFDAALEDRPLLHSTTPDAPEERASDTPPVPESLPPEVVAHANALSATSVREAAERALLLRTASERSETRRRAAALRALARREERPEPPSEANEPPAAAVAPRAEVIEPEPAAILLLPATAGPGAPEALSNVPPTAEETLVAVPPTDEEAVIAVLPTAEEAVIAVLPTAEETVATVPPTAEEAVIILPTAAEAVDTVPPTPEEAPSAHTPRDAAVPAEPRAEAPDPEAPKAAGTCRVALLAASGPLTFEWLERCLARDPEDSQARLDLCTTLLVAERFADAERVAREGLERDASSGRLLLRLSEALAGQDRTGEALDVAIRAVRSHRTRKAILHLTRLSALAHRFAPSDGARLRKALESRPRDPVFLHALGIFESLHGSPRHALTLLRLALRLERTPRWRRIVSREIARLRAEEVAAGSREPLRTVG